MHIQLSIHTFSWCKIMFMNRQQNKAKKEETRTKTVK